MSPLDVVRQISHVVSLPSFLSELDKAMNDPRCSLERVADIISGDIGLSARLLKLVNSSFYAFPSPIDTISRAVSVVGTKQLRDLAFTTAVLGAFHLKDHHISLEKFWQHSIACGLVAKAIATYRRDSDLERYFLLGVMHDIGRLILLSEFPDKMDQALAQAKAKQQLLSEAEHAIFGFDHAQVGNALLKTWKLPNAHQEIVLYHHAPEKAFRYPVETTVIHLSDLIVNALRLGNSGERFVPVLSPKVDEILHLSADALHSIIEHAENDYKAVSTLFLQDI